jgi:sarcosine oxidase subunit beta
MAQNNGKMWTTPDLRRSYEVVIIGGGVHGLATAYYLAKLGITNVAVLDKGYIGGGASGRNTAILRSNYRTPEGIAFFDLSLKLYEDLSQDLDFNVMFSQIGHITLAHNDSGVAGLRLRAENNKIMNIDSRLLDPPEIEELVPEMDVSRSARYPIMAGLYHPPGGIIRHDAVVWGYARGADRMGVHVHPFTEVTGIEHDRSGVTGVQTTRGRIAADTVVNCTAGYAGLVAALADVRLPIVTHPLQALVTEPLKPFLHVVIVSSTLHVYLSQSDRGELVVGSELDPYATYTTRSTLPFLEMTAGYVLDLFPQLTNVSVMRQWAGLCDVTPDFSPIISEVPDRRGFYVNVGWGTYGFKAGPAGGKLTAELIATRQTPELLEPFSLTRFREDRLVGEKAAASVSH